MPTNQALANINGGNTYVTLSDDGDDSDLTMHLNGKTLMTVESNGAANAGRVLLGDGVNLVLNNDATDTDSGYISLEELSASPGITSATRCTIYIEDNGSGKTRLMAQFGSGAAQQLAIEP